MSRLPVTSPIRNGVCFHPDKGAANYVVLWTTARTATRYYVIKSNITGRTIASFGIRRDGSRVEVLKIRMSA